jgi:UDPglucose 6-dehydrogenase
MKKRLLIIGYGVVGQAVYEGLVENNIIDLLDIEPNDDIDYSSYDGIIICLPTPQGPRGECDDMMVEQYHRSIRMEVPAVPILIKSTISPELVELLEDDQEVTYNPEFLTEADSYKQFCHQKFAIFGGHHCRSWYELYINSGIKIDKVRFTSMKNAAYAKYTINSFLATKVIFFNELYNMYCDDGFDELTEIIAMDERIGKSHMMVPGPDREFGFGGMCLPKDTLAFATSASRKGSPLKLLEEAILINKEIR